MITLNHYSDVLGTPDEKNKYFRFVVICGDTKRAFEIKASDLQSKHDWLQAIRKVINCTICETVHDIYIHRGKDCSLVCKSFPTD